MKFFKIFNLLLPLFLMVSLVSCDKIEPPYMVGGQQDNNGSEEVVRKFLLEEFTGHRCVNCPQGSQVAKTLKEFYGDRLIIVSVHAGFFANPLGSTFNYDFRTPEGNEINSHFGVMQNPIGMVNRQEFEGSLLLGPGLWGSAMAIAAETEPDFSLQLSVSSASGSGNYLLNAKVEGLNNLELEHYLVAVVIENGIIKPQAINDPDYPEGYIAEYEHNFVLRKGITSIWGDKLRDGGIEQGEVFERDYAFSMDAQWVAANSYIVAYVMNQNMEVLQAEQIRVE